MRIYFILLIISTILLSNAFKLTLEDKKYIKSLPNKKVIARRFLNFYKFIKKTKNDTIIKKLNRTNYYINRIISKGDIGTNEWITPKEFLIRGRGDCEDYAFTKYFTLRELGISKDRLFLAVVKVKGALDYHMVLYYQTDNYKYLVLDNLSWKVLPMSKRKDLTFTYAFNHEKPFIFYKNKLVEQKGIKRLEVQLFNDMFKDINN